MTPEVAREDLIWWGMSHIDQDIGVVAWDVEVGFWDRCEMRTAVWRGLQNQSGVAVGSCVGRVGDQQGRRGSVRERVT